MSTASTPKPRTPGAISGLMIATEPTLVGRLLSRISPTMRHPLSDMLIAMPTSKTLPVFGPGDQTGIAKLRLGPTGDLLADISGIRISHLGPMVEIGGFTGVPSRSLRVSSPPFGELDYRNPLRDLHSCIVEANIQHINLPLLRNLERHLMEDPRERHLRVWCLCQAALSHAIRGQTSGVRPRPGGKPSPQRQGGAFGGTRK